MLIIFLIGHILMSFLEQTEYNLVFSFDIMRELLYCKDFRLVVGLGCSLRVGKLF